MLMFLTVFFRWQPGCEILHKVYYPCDPGEVHGEWLMKVWRHFAWNRIRLKGVLFLLFVLVVVFNVFPKFPAIQLLKYKVPALVKYSFKQDRSNHDGYSKSRGSPEEQIVR